jgi:hypothetical protein
VAGVLYQNYNTETWTHSTDKLTSTVLSVKSSGSDIFRAVRPNFHCSYVSYYNEVAGFSVQFMFRQQKNISFSKQ